MTSRIKRLGFLIPPGNPTVEPELYTLAPSGVTVHFSRLFTRAATGTLAGIEDRTRSYLADIDSTAMLLALAKPDVIVMAYTAGSYALGRAGEQALCSRMSELVGCPFITAFGSVISALRSLNVDRVALGTPYSESITLQGKIALECHGIEVVRHGRLPDVENIYDETLERAATLARSVDDPTAQAIFLSGVGLPTIGMLEAMERELQKPVISAVSATMWNALRTADVRVGLPGYGRLLATLTGVQERPSL